MKKGQEVNIKDRGRITSTEPHSIECHAKRFSGTPLWRSINDGREVSLMMSGDPGVPAVGILRSKWYKDSRILCHHVPASLICVSASCIHIPAYIRVPAWPFSCLSLSHWPSPVASTTRRPCPHVSQPLFHAKRANVIEGGCTQNISDTFCLPTLLIGSDRKSRLNRLKPERWRVRHRIYGSNNLRAQRW